MGTPMNRSFWTDSLMVVPCLSMKIGSCALSSAQASLPSSTRPLNLTKQPPIILRCSFLGGNHLGPTIMGFKNVLTGKAEIRDFGSPRRSSVPTQVRTEDLLQELVKILASLRVIVEGLPAVV